MATLKISDLSVGDWVMVNGKPRKISTLSEVWNGSNEVLIGYVVHVYPNGYNVVFYKPIEHVKPIPITAEILEKNGFELDSSCWRIYRNGGGHIEIWEDEDRWYLSVNSKDTLCKLHWVHQIQHLMRVWGIDKEINL